jgi:hypothetical protein
MVYNSKYGAYTQPASNLHDIGVLLSGKVLLYSIYSLLDTTFVPILVSSSHLTVFATTVTAYNVNIRQRYFSSVEVPDNVHCTGVLVHFYRKLYWGEYVTSSDEAKISSANPRRGYFCLLAS